MKCLRKSISEWIELEHQRRTLTIQSCDPLAILTRQPSSLPDPRRWTVCCSSSTHFTNRGNPAVALYCRASVKSLPETCSVTDSVASGVGLSLMSIESKGKVEAFGLPARKEIMFGLCSNAKRPLTVRSSSALDGCRALEARKTRWRWLRTDSFRSAMSDRNYETHAES